MWTIGGNTQKSLHGMNRLQHVGGCSVIEFDAELADGPLIIGPVVGCLASYMLH